MTGSESKIKVAVLVGGPSPEHDVSLSTGKVISKNLDRSIYDIEEVLIPRDENKVWKLPEKVDVAFVAMHGAFGEDGTIQAILEKAGIPYVGSGVSASALAMDKIKSAEVFRANGLLVPDHKVLERERWNSKTEETSEYLKDIKFPVVVKPVDCGSSVGVTIVRESSALAGALKSAFDYSSRLLVQEYISGDEVTCGVLDERHNNKPLALPPTQIIPKKNNFFDYAAKYTPNATDEITPPKLPNHVISKIQETAIVAHKALECRDMSRTDMIVAGEKIFVLETNTIPGMTATSLYPQAAAVAGVSFPILLNKLVQSALNAKEI